MIVLAPSDFVDGKYDIPDADSNHASGTVQSYITLYEKKYIYLVFGVAEGNKIIAWLAANRLPANVHYSKIIDGFEEDSNSDIVQSLGLKEYLKAAIFYEYQKNILKTSQGGIVKSEVETAATQTPAGAMRFAESKYNDSVDTALAMQWYCENNEDEFPDYNGQTISVKYSNLI